MKKALITGVTGQDGSYLAEFLLERGYEVHGIIRRSSAITIPRIIHLYHDPHEVPDERFRMHYGDMSDGSVIRQLIHTIRPDEIYHLAAQSHVRVSFDIPEYTGDVTALGATRVLDAVRNCGYPVKFYQASSSEMFGEAVETPQKETTPLRPRSPYACAKTYAHWLTVNYREAYGLFAVNGILFNHESPRRGETFVSRKITRGISRIKAGLDKKLYLGNLKARRDWGYAPDYVQAMWMMLQQDTPDDYVIATGQSHSVEEFLTEAFTHAGLGDWRPYVEIDPRYFRPTEVRDLVGDASKAERVLGWRPAVNFQELVAIMVDADLEAHGVLRKPRRKRARAKPLETAVR